jgi:hypothetical protein
MIAYAYLVMGVFFCGYWTGKRRRVSECFMALLFWPIDLVYLLVEKS